MDMQAALRARLTGLASGRVYWIERPQGTGLPAITLQTIDDPRPQHLKGFDPLRPTMVQMDIWGKTYAETKVLAESALAAAVPEQAGNGIRFNRAMVDGVRDRGEQTDTIFIHRVSIDLQIWWSVE